MLPPLQPLLLLPPLHLLRLPPHLPMVPPHQLWLPALLGAAAATSSLAAAATSSLADGASICCVLRLRNNISGIQCQTLDDSSLLRLWSFICVLLIFRLDVASGW